MKKVFSIMLKVMVIIITLITASISKAGKVKAAQINEEYLYEKGSYANMLTYNGVEVLTTYVVYEKNGVEYPAYCISMDKPGVGEKGNYVVNTDNQLSDVNLWKIVRNGYPYMTPSQLGCANKEEAYTATKHAIYCYLASRSVESYGAIGEAGIRVKNAMNKILTYANETQKYSTEFRVYSNKQGFEIDKKDTRYMSQTFFMSAYYSLFDVKLSLEGNYPEGTKIVDYNNKEITGFTGSVSFKVIYPIQNAGQSGSFSVKAVATMNTYPVLYGKSYDSSLQDYVLTGDRLGDSETSVSLNYNKNNTQITINKKETGTNTPLEGVRFRILDSAKNPVYSELVTDKNGKTVIENMLPGKYYVEEMATKEGYVKYDQLITVDLELGQSMSITVNNSKENKNEYNSSTGEITVTQNVSHTIINENEVIINKNENESTTDVNTNNTNKNENKQETNTNININNENVNKNEQETNNNTNISNENINTNEQTTNNNTNISNENVNTNEQTTNNNTNISNENVNANEQTTNTNTNISNENVNTNEQTTNTNTNISNENINTNEQISNSNTNISNENINTNEQTTNNNINISNQNVNTNTQSTNTNTNITNQNTNTNIQNLNGIVKLPKTGM